MTAKSQPGRPARRAGTHRRHGNSSSARTRHRYEDIHRLVDKGGRSARSHADGGRLFLELRERGYRGSNQVVRKQLAALRAGATEPVRADSPSPRKSTSWIMRPRDTLTQP